MIYAGFVFHGKSLVCIWQGRLHAAASGGIFSQQKGHTLFRSRGRLRAAASGNNLLSSRSCLPWHIITNKEPFFLSQWGGDCAQDM